MIVQPYYQPVILELLTVIAQNAATRLTYFRNYFGADMTEYNGQPTALILSEASQRLDTAQRQVDEYTARRASGQYVLNLLKSEVLPVLQSLIAVNLRRAYYEISQNRRIVYSYFKRALQAFALLTTLAPAYCGYSPKFFLTAQAKYRATV